MLLFNAYGLLDLDEICALIQRTCQWASIEELRLLLYPTIQHSAAVRTQSDALSVLHKCMHLHATSTGHTPRAAPPTGQHGLTAAEELLRQKAFS
jgi:hypothetical protein